MDGALAKRSQNRRTDSNECRVVDQSASRIALVVGNSAPVFCGRIFQVGVGLGDLVMVDAPA